jgi:hypothetical protein
MNFRSLVLILLATYSCQLAAASNADTLHQLKPKNSQPVVLRELVPVLDNQQSKPASKTIELRAEQLRNLDITSDVTDWNRIYSIGRQAYIDGDFRRALNAFELALRQIEESPGSDPRVVQTHAAIAQVQTLANTLPAKAGYRTKAHRVEQVFPGSLAWLAGLRSGDYISSIAKKNQSISLTLSRAGKTYHVEIGAETSAFAKDSRNVSLSGQNAKFDKRILRANVLDQQWLAASDYLLNDYDKVIMIDKSSSMAEDALPGISKWQWCRIHMTSLYTDNAPNFVGEVDVIPFDTEFQVFEHASLQDVAKIYERLGPSGGTVPDGALSFELEGFFERRKKNAHTKPLLIAVLTDGLPSNPDTLRDIIFDATMRMAKPQDVCITFLQIGDSFRSSRILAALDDYMVDAGARYDVVNTTDFSILQKVGIKNALIAALLRQQPTRQNAGKVR